jgi:hypothetical protein
MGREGGSKMFSLPLIQMVKNLIVYLISFAKYFSFIGVFLGILGILKNKKNFPKLFWFLTFMFLFITIASINYSEFRIQVFFIPAYLIFSFWLALGLEEILSYNVISKITSKKLFKIGLILIMIFILIYPQYALTNILDKYPPKDRKGKIIHLFTSPNPFKFRNNYEIYNYGKKVLNKVEPNSIIFATWTALCILKYFKYVERFREDVIIYHNWREDILEIIKKNIDKKSIYFTDYVKNDYFGQIEPLRSKLKSEFRFIKIKEMNLIKVNSK